MLNKVLYKFFIYGYLHKMADELGATAKDVDKAKMEKKDDNSQRDKMLIKTEVR